MAEVFQQDMTCSVCLDLFTKPVLLACGHCFCQQCITSSWDNQERVANCPECRAPCPDRKYTPSRLLQSLAQRVWQIQREKADSGAGREAAEKTTEDNGERESELCCEVHGDSVALFCLTDQAPICYLCVDSFAHAGHSFSSLQDGVQTCKEKLTQWLESLEFRVEKLERHRCGQERHVVSLRDSAVSLRENIEAKFSELQQFLNQRKDTMLAQLEEKEKGAHNDMETRLRQIQEGLNYALYLMNQGRALMEKKNPAAFLVGIQPFLHIMTEGNEDKEDSFAVLCKELCLRTFDSPVQHLACVALYSAFKLELEPVLLDPKTSHPIFIISQKQTSVMIAQSSLWRHSKNPKRSENCRIVLGENGFLSGEHYWEIKAKDAADWVIGVATESIKRKVQVPLQAFGDKVWAIQLPKAKDMSSKDGTLRQRFGVYLNYDKGQVSFYDANYCHISTLRAQFKEEVYPLFGNIRISSGKNASLTICHKQDM